jgi:hypothetical protein
MRTAVPPLPQYASMAWYSVKAQGQHYPLTSHLLIGVRSDPFHVVLKQLLY